MNPTTTPGTVFSTPSDREVAWTRSFAAPRERVFRAFTEPEHVQRWLLGPDGWTMPICEMDLRVGGEWRYVWRNADGGEFAIQGVFREIERPARLVYTESMMGSEALQTIVLTEEDGITTMVSSLLYGSRAERDAAIATGMEEGASQSYDRLAEVLATCPEPVPSARFATRSGVHGSEGRTAPRSPHLVLSFTHAYAHRTRRRSGRPGRPDRRSPGPERVRAHRGRAGRPAGHPLVGDRGRSRRHRRRGPRLGRRPRGMGPGAAARRRSTSGLTQPWHCASSTRPS